jgi:peptidoglycan/xylan/chitin deacetylase (PgdA/CDA1 family)
MGCRTRCAHGVADRFRKAALAALLVAITLPLRIEAQSLAFTFDDGLDPRNQPHAREWNDRILATLDAAGVKAGFFPAGKNVESPAGMELVKDWSRRGHLIGNHTYSHRNLNSDRVTLDDFTGDVLRADAMLRALPGWSPRLRFPYLKEGSDAAKRDGIRDWMSAHGYRPAPVSIDTSDWYYSPRYVAWRSAHAEEDGSRFRDAYLAHLLDRANYYEVLARDVLGRSPTHVMLLHTNAINAAFLSDAIAMFRKNGWKIVSADAAFADPLYAMKPATLPAGESIVWALAKDAGRPGLRYPAEDDVYEIPKLKQLER